MSLPFLQGELLYLRALTEADAQGAYPAWFNDPVVCRGNSHHVYPYTAESAVGFIRRAAQFSGELHLAIVLRDGHRHIGNIALQAIHPVYRSAEFAVVIGDRDAWGKGYSKEAGLLLVGHGFRAMNLHRIACGTFATNQPMIRLAAALGMREEGRCRQAAFKDGRYVDLVEFGVLAHEFLQQFGD